jgi:hypothetical protein
MVRREKQGELFGRLATISELLGKYEGYHKAKLIEKNEIEQSTAYYTTRATFSPPRDHTMVLLHYIFSVVPALHSF